MDEQSIFLKALQAETPQERAAFLAESCGGDEDLLHEVELLLKAHDKAGDFLEGPPTGLGQNDDKAIVEKPGVQIGPYKLMEQIGEGGFGIVFVAEQQQPVRRRVALKVIKPGMDSGQVIARFEAERQALAMMDHINIAKVLDAGTTESGRPYFVMELVHGTPITTYCDENKLTSRARLVLFASVCQAIHHAHQKGIIHRDIKPSNILVTMYDSEPIPKVIDFGIAKAVEQKLTEKTIYTQFGMMVGTLEYVSPEQAEMNDLGVDTRTDVYSLGVLLYELLTGTTPLDGVQLRQAAYGEIVRLIKEEEPIKPSIRLSKSDAKLNVAAARRTNPVKLSSQIKGELDWIVMRCLEKDRSRRYDGASSLARDVIRYLANVPVEACPPTLSYRFSKAFARHRAAILTAASIGGTLLLATAISLAFAIQSRQAEQSARRHESQAKANENVAKKRLDEANAARLDLEIERKKLKRLNYAHTLQLARVAIQGMNVKLAIKLLQSSPQELRGWEWHYVRRLCNTELLRFQLHQRSVWDFEFSPNGDRIASLDNSVVHIWNSHTGQSLRTIQVDRGYRRAMAFSPSGKQIAVVVPGRITIYDALTGNTKVSFKLKAQTSDDIAFSPDGRKIAVSGGGGRWNGRYSNEGVVVVLDAQTGKRLHYFGGMHSLCGEVEFSADGKLIAAVSIGDAGEAMLPGEVRIWKAKTGELAHRLPELGGHMLWDVAFSPDNKHLATAGADGLVHLWSLDREQVVRTFRGHEKGTSSVSFSGDGKTLASASNDRTVRIWNVASGQQRFVLAGHTDAVTGVCMSRDGRRVVSRARRDLRVWDATMPQSSRVWYGPGATSVAFSADSKLLAGASMNHIEVRDVEKGKLQHTSERKMSSGGSNALGLVVLFHPDGRRLLTTGSQGGVNLWDHRTRSRLHIFPDYRKSTRSWTIMTTGVALTSDGSQVATIGSGALTLRKTDSGDLVKTIKTPDKYVAYSPDGRWIATAHDPGDLVPGAVTLWNAKTGRQHRKLRGGGLHLAFSRDGKRLASGSPDGEVPVWDPESGELQFKVRHNARVRSVAFSPDGRRLATGGKDETIKLWNTEDGGRLLTLRGHQGKVVCVTFSPNGRYLASAGGNPLQYRLWDAGPQAVRAGRARMEKARKLVALSKGRAGKRQEVTALRNR